jgi:hypothetical protein
MKPLTAKPIEKIIIALIIAAVLSAGCAFLPSFAYAAAVSTDYDDGTVNLAIEGYLAIEGVDGATFPDLNPDSNPSDTATDGGITINSNYAGGYKLTVQAGSNTTTTLTSYRNTALYLDSVSTLAQLQDDQKITAYTGSSLPANTWGVKISNKNALTYSGNYLAPTGLHEAGAALIPDSNDNALLDSGDVYEVTYGATINNALQAGAYTNTVTFTLTVAS